MDPLTLITGALDFHTGPLDPESADRLFPLRGGWSATYGLVQVGRAVGVRAGCRRTGRIPQRTSTYLRVPTKCPPVEESPSRQTITVCSALYTLRHKGARTT